MKREDILKNPGYWITRIQTSLYNCAETFMSNHNLNRTQLAERLGVSKGYVSQLLNGDYDHKLSKLVELSLAFGFVPKIEFQSLQEAITEDRFEYSLPKWHADIKYTTAQHSKVTFFADKDDFFSEDNFKAA